MVRHSRLQLQVLALYRQCLRVARDKPGAVDYVRSEFRKNQDINKSEVMRIEHLLRRGQRQLESLQKPTTTGVGFFQKGDTDPSSDSQAELPDHWQIYLPR